MYCLEWGNDIRRNALATNRGGNKIVSAEESLRAFDEFYASERYPGCQTYIRTNSLNCDNGGIDLWGNKEYDKLKDFTHASIKGDVDGHMHGYDWESKAGEGIRLFHPRNSLRGFPYGDILFHYDPVNTNQRTYTLDECIADGRAKIANYELNDIQRDIINLNIKQIDHELYTHFMSLFIKWQNKKENVIQSNPYIICNCDEYRSLVHFIKVYPELRYCLYDMINQGESYAIPLFIQTIVDTNDYYKKFDEEFKAKAKLNKHDDDGKFIVYTPLSNAKAILKYILEEESIYKIGTSDRNETILDPSYFKVSQNKENIHIELNIDIQAKIRLDILDLEGRIISTIQESDILCPGKFDYVEQINQRGTYLIRLIKNGIPDVKKIII